MSNKIVMSELSIPELQQLVATLNTAIDNTNCPECSPPPALIINRDAAEDELNIRGHNT